LFKLRLIAEDREFVDYDPDLAIGVLQIGT